MDGISTCSPRRTPRRLPGRALAAAVCLALSLLVATAAGQGGDAPAATATDAGWRPAPTPLSTRWAADVGPASAHPEYPRPQLVRDAWLNLNGLWDLALADAGAGAPGGYDRRILVPFPLESSLSGVGERLGQRAMWYRRTFEVPTAWAGERVLLHFGAVDFDATVSLNGHRLGSHRGGYDAFTFDVTDALWPFGPQELVVRVTDPTDGGSQPRGKQVEDPQGIWYTPSSGIWQTVWLEPVPDSYIDRLEIVPDLAAATLRVTAVPGGTPAEGARVAVTLRAAGAEVARATGRPGEAVELHVPDPHPWSPSDPYLYDLDATLTPAAAGATAAPPRPDAVRSYAALRSIAVGRAPDGATRLLLNGEPLFQYGVLDQGFWPDGLYTAPTDEAVHSDLETAKRLGFNMVRKHVKVEPDTYYAWADRLGLLVWQDMPSGDASAPQGGGEIARSPASAEQFETELDRMVSGLANHPSIVVWVLFNEGWGQYDTTRLTAHLRALDPTRLVDAASGWNDLGVGDLVDVHRYPGPGAPPAEDGRASVLGEFGGLGLPVAGLTWVDQGAWGYQAFDDPLTWSAAYARLLEQVRSLELDQGLSAAVYTQLTDVESEVNGLMTYDRSLVKAEPTALRHAARTLSWPLPLRTVLAPTSETGGQTWRFTTDDPGDGWTLPGFDDGGWATGPGGFGRSETPGSVVRTPWTTRQIWLRRTFMWDPAGADATSLVLRIHHDEDADVYLNGTRLVALPYSTPGYVDVPLGAEAAGALRPGANTLALHCRQLGFGQYCDAGLVVVQPGGAP